MRHREAAFWGWLLDSEVQLVDFGLADRPRMRAWRESYADREVDFADNTRVKAAWPRPRFEMTPDAGGAQMPGGEIR